MSGGKHLNVDMRFTADTSQAKSSIQELNRLLDKALNQPSIGLGGSGISAEINKAKIAATELKVKLQDAMRTDGSLDLVKFNNSLQTSGKTLGDYGSALSKLGANGKQAFLQLTQSISTANISLERSNGMVNQLWTTLKNVARFQISSSVIHTLVGGISSAYGYAQDLNESLNNIRIVTNQSAEEMSLFADRANKAARSLSSTTLDYTNASLIYYQQGLSDEEVARRAETTLKLANVSRQTAETVSDQMTAIWNNFDDGSKSLEYYADVMSALGAATASSQAEIAVGMEKFASVAKTVGLSYENAAAALATIVAQTRQSADTVGTGLRTIFARLQSLKLGETLEDGVGLSKYTEALAKIGVNVLDANGKLKEMDTILFDIGEKWQTLDKTQRITVANTVGGVRQYTNLIALFDNFDKFKDNIQIAEGSEGTLNKQAEIYAESWEAARDRVKAAAEAIYKSLIDDNFFIGVDNFIEKNLNGVNNLIKALGGIPGVLSVVSTAFFTIFGPQLASSIDGIIERIKFMSGATQNSIIKMKQDANNQLANMYTNSTRPGDQVAHAAYQSQANFSNEILNTQLDKTKQLSAEEQKIVQLLQEQHAILVQNTVEAGKQYEEAEHLFNLEAARIEGQGKVSPGKSFSEEDWVTETFNAFKGTSLDSGLNGTADAILNIKLHVEDVEKAALNAGQSVRDFLKDQNYSKEAITAFESMAEAAHAVKTGAKEGDAGVQKLIDRFLKLKTIEVETFDATQYRTLIDETKAYADQLGKLETAQKALNQFKLNSPTTVLGAADVDALTASLAAVKAAAGEGADALEKAYGQKAAQLFQNLSKELQSNTKDFTKITDLAREFFNAIDTASGDVNQHIEDNFDQIEQILAKRFGPEKAEAMVGSLRDKLNEVEGASGRVSQGFGNMASSSVVLKQYLESVKGELQTIGQTMTTVASGLSGLASFISTLKGLKETWNDTTKSFSDKMLSTAAASSTLIFSFDRMIKGAGAAPKLFTAIGSAAESAGRYLIGAASATGSIAASAVSAGTAIAAFAGTIVAVIAVIGGLIAIAKKVYDALHEDEIVLANFKEATEQLKEQAKEARTSADNLKSSIDKYDSAVDKLKQCTDQTKEWKEAFDEVNIAASGILETVKENLSQEDYNAFLQEYLQTGTFNRDTINQALVNANERTANLELANASSSYMTEAKSIQNQINDWIKEVFKVDTPLPIDISDFMEADTTQFEQLLKDFGVSLDDFEKGALNKWYQQVQSFKAAIEGNYTELKVAEQANIRAKVETFRPESVKDQDLLNFVLNSQAEQQKKLISEYTNKFRNISNLVDASDDTYEQILTTLQGLGYKYTAYDKGFLGYGGAVEGDRYNRTFNFTDENREKISLSAETLGVLVGLQQSLENVEQDINKYDDLIRYTSNGEDSPKVVRSAESTEAIKELLAHTSEDGIDFSILGSKLGKAQLEELIQAYNDSSDDRISEIDSILQENFQLNYNDFIELISLFGGNFDAAIKSIINSGKITQGLIEQETKNYSDNIKQILKDKDVELDLSHASKLTTLLNDNTKATIDFEKGLAESEDVIKYIDEAYEKLQKQAEETAKALHATVPNFTEIYETLDKIKNGVLKEDDYQTLVNDGLPTDVLDEFFVKTSEGIYMLIGDAEDLKAAIEQIQIDSSINKRNNSGLYDLYSIENFNQEQGYDETSFNKLLEVPAQISQVQQDAVASFLRTIGGYDEILNKIQNSESPYSIENLKLLQEAAAGHVEEWTKLPDALQGAIASYIAAETEIATMADSLGKLDELSKQYNLSNDAIANGLLKLGASYENCNTELQNYKQALKSNNDDSIIAAEGALRLAIRAGELAESAGTSANDVERLAKAIKDSSNDANITSRAYAEMAKDTLRVGQAVESAKSNLLKWQEAIEQINSTPGTFLDVNTANQLAEAYGDLLDLDGSQLSNSFLSSAENLQRMKTALEGTGEEAKVAYNELLQLAQEDMDKEIKIRIGEEAFAEFETQVQAIEDQIASLPEGAELGVELNGTENVLDALTDIVNAAEMTKQQATDYLSSMGIDAEVEEVPDKDTHVNTYTGANAHFAISTVRGTNPTTGEEQDFNIPSVWYTPVPMQATDENAITGFALKVTSANKSSGGNTKITRSGGGTGPITSKSSGGGGSRSPSSSSPSSSSSTKSPRSLTKHTKADVNARYHTIKEYLSDTEKDLSEATRKKERSYGETRLQYLNKEIELRKQALALQQQQTAEMHKYLSVDKQAAINALKQFGLNIQFDSRGVITNYEQLYDKLLDLENSYIDQQNSYNSSGDEIPEYLKEQVEAIAEAKAAITQYETTLNGLEDSLDATAKAIDELNDALLEQVTTKINLKLDINDDEAKMLDYYMQKYSDDIYSAAEAMSILGKQAQNTFQRINILQGGVNNLLSMKGMSLDSFNDGLMSGDFTSNDISQLREWRDGLVNTNLELLKMEQNVRQQIESSQKEIKSLQKSIRDTEKNIKSLNKQIKEANEQIEELQLEQNVAALEKINEKLTKQNELIRDQNDLFNRYSNILQTYKDITNLMGKAVNRNQEKLIDDLNNALLHNSKNTMIMAKRSMEDLAKQRLEIEQLLGKAVNENNEEMVEKYKDILKQMDQEVQNYEQQYLTAWQNTMNQAQQIFETAVDNILDDFDKGLSGAFGSLDYLKQAFDRQSDIDGQYLKDYDKLYELNKMQRDLNKTLSNTTNADTRADLLALQKEINLYQQQGVQLSKYDIDALKAKIALQQSYNDLQVSQNAKNTVRLTRDAGGNWGYVYTANTDDIAKAEQSYEDKLKAYQKLNDDYLNELQNKVIEVQTTYRDYLKEILTDMSLSDLEREARIKELNNWLSAQQSYFNQQSQGAFKQQSFTIRGMTNYYKVFSQDILDSWNKTKLATLTGADSLSAYMNLWTGNSTTLLDDLTEALSNRRKDLDEILQLSGTNILSWGETVQGTIDSVGKASDDVNYSLISLSEVINTSFAEAAEEYSKRIADVREQIDNYNDSLSDAHDSLNDYIDSLAKANDKLSAAQSWQREYAGAIKEMIAQNERFIESLNRLIITLANTNMAQNQISNNIPMTNTDIIYDEIVLDERGEITELWKNGIRYNSNGMRFDTGGYTGEWGPEGKLAILDEKEQVFNANDTANLLEAATILRKIDMSAFSMIASLGKIASPSIDKALQTVQQEVHIEASFPNANNHYEIEEAFNNLSNKAIQYVNRKNNL